MMQLITKELSTREAQLEVGKYILGGMVNFRHGRNRAITTLQIGATLTPIPADQIALYKAAEYLLDALASQLKPFQQALAVDCSNKNCLESS